MTQRLVPGVGKSVIVNGPPSGPVTYVALGRLGSNMNTRTRSTEQLGAMLAASSNFFARELNQWTSRLLHLGRGVSLEGGPFLIASTGAITTRT